MTQVFFPHASRTAVLVLCLNVSRAYTFHFRRKSKSASKWFGLSCQCSVLVCAGRDSQSAGPMIQLNYTSDLAEDDEGGGQMSFRPSLTSLVSVISAQLFPEEILDEQRHE